MKKNFAPLSSSLRIGTVRDQANTLDLRYAVSTHNNGKYDRYVAFCNGRTEWIEKYTHLLSELELDATTGVVTWDHRGQGVSGGARAWIDNYSTYSKDTAAVINATVKETPYNLVCHSMGCLIALNAVMDGFIKPRCIILSSPLLGLPHRPLEPSVAYKISNAMTKIGLGHVNTRSGRHWKPPFERNLLTHSGERYKLIQNPPYPVPSATFGWVKATYEATQAILDPERLKKLTMPILVMCGTEEGVVDVNAIQPWIEQARKYSSSTVDLHWIQGGKHELFFESKSFFDEAKNYALQWFSSIGFPI